jgi:hypothetical protein
MPPSRARAGRHLIPGCELLTGRNQGAGFVAADSEIAMRKKAMVICEICGGSMPSGAADFLVFHCLAFCSPDCRDDYRTADEERRARLEAAGQKPAKRRAHAA